MWRCLRQISIGIVTTGLSKYQPRNSLMKRPTLSVIEFAL